MATLLKEIAVGNAVGTWYLRLYEDRITQDVATNISTVYWRLTLRCSVVGASISFDSRDAWINTSHFTIAYSHSGAEHDLGTGSALIGHNADGTGSYSVGFGISTSYALSGSAMGGRTLPTIPRASSFTLSGDSLGSAITVNISRASASFTHTVKYQFGNIVREYTGQTTSCSFTPPVSDASQIPNLDYGTASITVTTYNGSTQIGNPESSSITLYLPTSVVPSFSSLSIARVDNGVPPAWGDYVQGKSKATLTINGASGIYGSSIKSYSISGGGYSTTSASFTTGVLAAGTIVFTATIIDSRGRSVSKTQKVTVYDNSLPSLTLKAERCNSAKVVSNTGTYLKVTPIYGCASVNEKNTIASKSFKIVGTSYANTEAFSGASFVLGNNDIAISKSYTVTGVVTDALGQSSGTISFTVSSSAVPFNLKDDGTGAAFGKYAEKANCLESSWPIYMQGKSLIDTFFPIGTVLTNGNSSFNPNTLYPGTTWVRIKGKVIVGVDEADGSFNTLGKTGGHKELQSHTHTGSTGSTGAHSHRISIDGYEAEVGVWFSEGTTRSGVNWDMPSPPRRLVADSNGAHTHTVSIGSAGGGNAGNLQPYITKYIWERTA